ncbi:putative phosphoglycerate mutase [Frondihabitans sp. PhB188]|nr:putative phosphoglycerate mutase [Frondihabitans sp. PhB188]
MLIQGICTAPVADARPYAEGVRILLIRHAQTTANAGGILSTAAPGPELTELGRAQAEALVDRLAHESIAGIFVSSLQRTAQTAAPLGCARGLEIEVVDGVHEIEAGDFEGTNDTDSMTAYLAPIRRWAEGDLAATVPGAYDGSHFLGRFDGALAAIAERHDDDSTVVVVSHAGSIRVWLGGRATNLDPAFSVAHSLDNAGVIELSGSPDGGWRVDAWQGEAVQAY